MEEWQKVQLGDVCETVSLKPKIIKEKMVLINTSDVFEGKVLNHVLSYTDSMAGQFRKRIQENDILFSEIRPNNKRNAYIDFKADDYICSTKLMVIKSKDKIFPRYLYYHLTLKETLNLLQQQAEARSGTFPQITFSNVSNLVIYLPPLSEQKAIVATLSCLDDMIELNNQTNKILEEMGQAIFKRWFVDFEFPDENDQPYKSSGGEMVESELGPIPKGWSVCILGEIIKFVKGKNPFSLVSYPEKDFIQYLNIDTLKNGNVLYCETNRMVLCSKMDTLMVMDGASSGTIYFGKEGAVASTLSKLSTPSVFNNYVYFLLKYSEKEVKKHTTGSAIPHADKKFVESLIFFDPHKECLLENFNLIADRLKRMIIVNSEQIIFLSSIRDSLLPKLMSGEIRVPVDEAS